MADRHHLSAGLAIIADCKARTGDIWEAHYGAAAIASYFFRTGNRLDAGTETAIARQTDAMIQAHGRPGNACGLGGDEGWDVRAGDGGKHAKCEAPVSMAPHTQHAQEMLSAQEAELEIVQALGETMDGLHWVGHNFIYAAHGLAAIRELGAARTEGEIAGIAALLRAFKGTIPGRSWIGFRASDVKRMALAADEDEGEAPAGPEQLSGLVLAELAAFKRIYRAEAHHDLIGHMLTFSHALNWLHDFGYADVFRKGVPQLLAVVKVLRKSRDLGTDEPAGLVSPVDRLPLRPAPRSEWLPTEETYWTRVGIAAGDWDFGHAFKFPCSFYDHLRRAAGLEGHPGEAAAENFRRIL